MQRLFGTVIALASAFALPAFGKTAAKKRELGEAFGKAVCDGTVGDDTGTAWKLAVFDAQVEGRRVSPLGGLKLKPEQMDRKAKTLARLRGVGSYASGLCADGTGWAVALPASAPLTADANGIVRLPVQDLSEQCESYRADFAPAEQGTPRTLSVASGTIPTAKLGDGVIGVTCQPKAPRWRGPALWYLYPTGKGPAASVPEGEIFAEHAAQPIADLLSAWVNRIRLKEGLKALEFKAELGEQASNLAVDGSLAHDRQLLKKTASILQETAQLKLIGEDRVKGKDAVRMAWLWWNSPRHRSLILNPGATAAGLASRSVGDEQLAVLAVAVSAPLQTAKAPTRKAKPANR